MNKRTGRPGSSELKTTDKEITIFAANATDGAPRLEMDRRIQNAVNAQAGAMMRRLKDLAIKEAAKKAAILTRGI